MFATKQNTFRTGYTLHLKLRVSVPVDLYMFRGCSVSVFYFMCTTHFHRILHINKGNFKILYIFVLNEQTYQMEKQAYISNTYSYRKILDTKTWRNSQMCICASYLLDFLSYIQTNLPVFTLMKISYFVRV